jgi:phosphoglycerol transferase
MLVVFVAVNAPTLAYWAEHGQNAVALDRPPGDSEKFGLKISRLVLPDEFHRVGFLGDIGEEGQRGSPVGSEPGQALGILGTIGFFTGVLAIFLHGLRRRGSRDLRPAHDREALIDHGGLLILLATLFGVIAGFSVVIAVSGFGEVRVWNRIMLTIAFLSLVLTAIWLERGAALLRRRLGRPAFALGIATAVLLAVALLDGRAPFPDNGFREWYVRSTEAAWVSDTRFVRGIENRMPDGAAIFQLPVRPFPEAPNLNAMEDYDLFRGYLHDDGTLRWSYGGMKGRPEADWQQRVKDPARQLPALVGMGFAGLYVDTAGLGADAPGYLAGLADVVGPAALTSENGRLVFFDLRAYADDLPQSDDALRRLATREFGIAPPESAQSGG